MLIPSMIEILEELKTCTCPKRRDELIRMRNLVLKMRKTVKFKGVRNGHGIHQQNISTFQAEILKELGMRTEPIRGCRLSEAVFPVLGEGHTFMKPCGQFNPGVLKFILEIPGVLLLKPNSKGTKVISEYENTNKDDKTAAYFVLESKWDGKLPA